MSKVLLRASAVFIVVAGISAVGTEARAECVAADVFVHRTGQPDQAVLTDGQCLVPTPWPANLRIMRDVRAPTPAGTPSGVFVEVWVPVP